MRAKRGVIMEQRNKIVMVVEDEPDIVNILKIRLENSGFDVLTAGDGKEALRIIKESLPVLVLLDLLMPEMNGMELCRALKSDDCLKGIPVIVLTAKCGDKDREEALEAGAEAYFTKPFEWTSLYAKIKEFF
jgi:DNA-binding response OmpR family regulator